MLVIFFNKQCMLMVKDLRDKGGTEKISPLFSLSYLLHQLWTFLATEATNIITLHSFQKWSTHSQTA